MEEINIILKLTDHGETIETELSTDIDLASTDLPTKLLVANLLRRITGILDGYQDLTHQKGVEH